MTCSENDEIAITCYKTNLCREGQCAICLNHEECGDDYYCENEDPSDGICMVAVCEEDSDCDGHNQICDTNGDFKCIV